MTISRRLTKLFPPSLSIKSLVGKNFVTEPLVRKEIYEGEIHRTFTLTNAILNQIDAELSSKIVKPVTLIYALEQFERLSQTKEEIIGIFSSAYSVVEIERAINTLRYNDERALTRFFAFQFISGAEVTANVDWNIKSEKIFADGIVYAIVPESEHQLKVIKENLLATSAGCEQFIFVLPKNFKAIDEITLEYSAAAQLRDNADDDMLFDEFARGFCTKKATFCNLIFNRQII